MPLDPQIKALLDKGAGLAPLHTLSVAQARARYEGRPRPPAPEVRAVAERIVQGPGGAMRLRIYSPRTAGPHPLLVFFHGSGFVVCSLDTHDGIARNLCHGAACVVVSVDYRLAPEARFPAASDDCLFATRWAAEHAAEFGADAARIILAGDSAGGNLAAVTALRVRDEGGPVLAGQLLIYPMTDHHNSGAPSLTENAQGYGLTRDAVIWFWDHYLGPSGDPAHPHAAPMRAPDLAGLPPALILTAEFDPLRDEAESYGQRLLAAAVPTRVVRCEAVNHGFLGWVGWVPKADAAMADACAWLGEHFAGG